MMGGSAKFWNRMARRYSKMQIADQATYEKKLEITRGYLFPEAEILEIGCGTGSTALLHAPHVKHIRATDIAENMTAIARERAREQQIENVDFEVAVIDDLHVSDASLDMVMAHNLLHLLDNRREVIARVYRMLRPGGVFVTSTACLEEGFRHLRPILWLGHKLGLLPYVTFLSASDLTRDFTDAGFTVAHSWRPGPKKALFMVLEKPA